MKTTDLIVGKRYKVGDHDIEVTENNHKFIKGINSSGEYKGFFYYQEHGGFCNPGKYGTGCTIHGNNGCIEIKEL